MWISKQSVRTFLSLAFSTQLLVACNLPSPAQKNEKQSGSTFTAKASTDRSKALEVSVKGAFAFPYQKVYNFQACVKGTRDEAAIAGHEFYIRESKSTVTSDKDGCFTWPEKYEYNYLGESKYVRIERTIEGRGLHKGSQKVAFAVNPWSHGESLAAVLNPDDGNEIPGLVSDPKAVEKALLGYNSEGNMVTRSLWVEDGRLFVTENKLTNNGIDLLVEMRPNVSLLLSKMNGELVTRPLTAGKFKANLQVIHLYQHQNQEIRRLLAVSEEISTQAQNGSVSVKANLQLPAIPTRGQLLLALKLVPVDGPNELTTFEGLYFLGEYDQIKGSSFLKLQTVASQTPNFKINEYINSPPPKPSWKNGNLQDDAYQKPKIEISQLDFKFIRIGEERTTTREVIYSIKACLKNGLDQKNTRAHTFKVTKFKQNTSDANTTIELKTDNNACLNWDEKIQFKYFDCQHYIPGHVQISNDDLGMNEKLDIIVNPWESSGGAIARDVRYVDPTEKTLKDCSIESRPRTQMIMDSFSYNALSYSYKIDALLGLEVQKKMQVKIEPRVLIYSSLSNGRSETQRLRDGVYLLRMVFVQNRDYSRDLNNYIDATEKLVNIISGQVNTEVTFKTSDLKAVANRNNVLVEIHPVIDEKVQIKGSEIFPIANETFESIIDNSTGLESPTFIGPINLNLDDASRPLKILDSFKMAQYLVSGKGTLIQNARISLPQIISEGQAQLRKIKLNLHQKAQKKTFAEDNNLKLISLAQAKQETLQEMTNSPLPKDSRLATSKKELQHFVNTGILSPALAQRLCVYWTQDIFKNTVPGQYVLQQESAARFSSDCYQTSYKDASKFFNWEKRLLVKQLASSEFVQGTNQGLAIGTSFSMQYSDSKSFTKSKSVGAKVGLSLKFFETASLGLDGGYSLSWSETQTKSSNNGMSVNGNTALTMQRNDFQLNIRKHESCVLIRLNPQIFMESKTWRLFRKDPNYLSSLNSKISEDQLALAVTRGLMVCEGLDRHQSVTINEPYFLISQETFAAQTQDSGDDRNRQFFFGLRSEHDFDSFLTATKSEIVQPQNSQADKGQTDTTGHLLKLIKNIAPQAPGMIRLTP